MIPTEDEIKKVKKIATEAQNIRIVNQGNSFEWDEPQCPGIRFSTQRITKNEEVTT